MKKSVNFNGMKRYRNLGANDLISTLRFLGMSDEEIKAKMLEMKEKAHWVKPTEVAETLNQQGEPGMRFIAIIRPDEPATPDEQMEAEKGREVEWLGRPKLIAHVHVTKSFAARWSTNPQDYKDYYHTDDVEIQE